jgi:hypothetical protein
MQEKERASQEKVAALHAVHAETEALLESQTQLIAELQTQLSSLLSQVYFEHSFCHSYMDTSKVVYVSTDRRFS